MGLQVTSGAPSATTLIHYQQVQPGTSVTGGSGTVQKTSVTLPVPMLSLQVVTSQTSSLIHQQILIQPRQMRKHFYVINVSNATANF